jgi:hypothetical protein
MFHHSQSIRDKEQVGKREEKRDNPKVTLMRKISSLYINRSKLAINILTMTSNNKNFKIFLYRACIYESFHVSHDPLHRDPAQSRSSGFAQENYSLSQN